MSPYRTLGVEKGATNTDIRKAFRRLTMKYHPDRNHGDPQAEERYKDIAVAYEILSDEDNRRVYDSGNFEVGDITDLDGQEILNKVKEFLDAFGSFIDVGDIDVEMPKGKKKAAKKKSAKKKAAKKKAAKKKSPKHNSGCPYCAGTKVQTFRQGSSTFQVPCRLCG